MSARSRLPSCPDAPAGRHRGGGGFVLEDWDGTITPAGVVSEDPDIRINEGGCDPDGRFYCGTMRYDRTAGGGAVYRLDPDLTIHRVLDGVTISNGLDWRPDGSRAYYIETPRLDASIVSMRRPTLD